MLLVFIHSSLCLTLQVSSTVIIKYKGLHCPTPIHYICYSPNKSKDQQKLKTKVKRGGTFSKPKREIKLIKQIHIFYISRHVCT